MTKLLALAAVLLIAPVTRASAAPVGDTEACNKLSFEVAEKASKAKLSDADAAKIEEKLSALDAQCAGGNFADAEATAKDIEAALPK